MYLVKTYYEDHSADTLYCGNSWLLMKWAYVVAKLQGKDRLIIVKSSEPFSEAFMASIEEMFPERQYEEVVPE